MESQEEDVSTSQFMSLCRKYSGSVIAGSLFPWSQLDNPTDREGTFSFFVSFLRSCSKQIQWSTAYYFRPIIEYITTETHMISYKMIGSKMI